MPGVQAVLVVPQHAKLAKAYTDLEAKQTATQVQRQVSNSQPDENFTPDVLTHTKMPANQMM